jgi:hypothetical protein
MANAKSSEGLSRFRDYPITLDKLLEQMPDIG